MSRREEAKAERRRRIVSAARDLIRETGDIGLSMRAIAARANVSLSTPYNLFGSKRAIVVAVLEDIREFHERFARLKGVGATDRLFQALAISLDYYVDDPSFYRTLWTGVFDMSGKEALIDLATPERSAFWRALLNAMAEEGDLAAGVDRDLLRQALDMAFAGVMLSWVLGTLEPEELLPAAGFGYALALRGAASAAGEARLAEKVAHYQERMQRLRQASQAA